MRTAVPLVRRLDPNETGPIELEFDVPAQADDPAPPIFIGVRVKGDNPTAAADAADRLQEANISAEVHLYRIQESKLVSVALKRFEWRAGPNSLEFVTLADDGLVPTLSSTNADFSTMEAAGLITLADLYVYKELEFAGASNVSSGRYQVVIRFAGNSKALFNENAELLIAYTHKSK